ncbi:MAG: penicillin acylase family protein, partial [Spirulinaceae cyanobacterium]
FYLWYEAHLVAADLDAYGVALVGMPGLAIAFNDHLGWTTTVNTFDGADVYDLTLAEGGYVWDGEVQPFTKESQTIKIKQEDGSFESEELTILNSLHGPVVAQQNNKAQALRVVGLDRPYILDQFWAMAKAQNLQQFEAALQSLQLPLFNILYADKAGEIFYLFNAQVPQREQGDWRYWSKTIPGDTAATLWTKYHPYEDLPRLVNPPSGWLQNTNDPPWLATFPQLLNPENYPAYLAPPSLGQAGEIFRTQRSIRMLQENTSMSFEELVALKFSSRLELADRLLDELIPAARELGNELGQEAAEVLAAWDRQVQADSRGAVLFSLWAVAIQQGNFFATPWQASAPLTTPKGLADLQQAVQTLEIVADTMKFLYGSVDVPWGEVVRLTYDKYNLPASGALGILGSFRVLYTVPMPEKGFRTFGGDSYIAAIEFGDGVKAKVLNTYGNATQPNSPHIGDQLPLYLRGELRKAWRDRKEIMVHLERKEVL